MSEQLQDYMSNLDGDIVLDSLIPANTSGAFCDLLSATHPTAGKLALKRPRGNCYDESVLARIEMEAGIWKMLRHPRILQFMGMYKIAEDIYLVSPFAENGSLPGFLRARPDADRKRLVIEIAEGLTYLHQCGIIHGDLKGNNTLISGEEHVLLCDFGLAKHVTSRTSTSLRGAGSIPWQSPEILRDASKRTFQSDVYAFGITIAEVLSGKEPYAHLSGIVSIITGVLFSGERPLKEPLNAPDGSSYLQLWEEASKCWDEDPQLRPSMFSVLKRLDPERVGMWVTAQQIALETSLDSSGDLGMMSNSEPVSDGLLGIAQGKDTLQTLRWASNIRSRLGVLFNSKQPISRITPELLAAIIWRDDTDVKLRPDHPLSHISKFSAVKAGLQILASRNRYLDSVVLPRLGGQQPK
ncbi:hypothetical protein FRC04_002377 [Tulasnella sp. 424]|nr:hypothetical protein FRC04_002377 [Tulasnella sp. 424]